MALNWPIRCEVEFFDYVYMEGDIPVYYMGSRMCHRMTLTNMTDTLGNAREWIEDLKVRVRQGEATGSDVLGVGPQSIQWLLTVLLLDSGEVASVSLSNSYAVPQSAAAGPNGTLVGLGFRFAGRSMAIEVTYTQAEGLWHAATPRDLNLDYAVSADDFTHFAHYWRHGEGDADGAWCRRI